MEHVSSLLLKGLGWGIVHSLWIGAIGYVLLLLCFHYIKKMSASTKSTMLFTSLMVLLASFIGVFCYHLFSGQRPSGEQNEAMDMMLLSLFNQESSLSIAAYIEHYFPMMITCYAIGVLFQLIWVVNGFRRLNYIRKHGLLAVPDNWRSVFERLSRQMGIRKAAKFELSSYIDVPAVIGHFKPVVLFPIALLSHLSIDQVEAVLIHELAHIKRMDYLFNVLKTIVETLLFFNPFVWLMSRMLEIERENACDDVVIAHTSKPIHYAKTLLQLEELQLKPGQSLAMQAIGKKKHLLNRIQRITSMKKNYLNAKHKLAILSLLLGCIVSLAWVRPHEEAKEKENQELIEVMTAIQGDRTNDLAKSKSVDPKKQQDTIRAKKKNITFTGKDGSILIFDSYEDLPDSLKRNFEGIRAQTDSLKAYFSSPEWKAEMSKIRLSTNEVLKMSDSLKRHFDSPEWKSSIRKHTDSINAYLNSPEWRDILMGEVDSITAYFKSEDWKNQMKGLSDSIQKHFNSPEWKSQMRQWEKEAKEIDTVLLGKMTLYGKKQHINQLLEQKKTLQLYQTKYQKQLGALQKQYASLDKQQTREYSKLMRQHKDQYVDSMKELHHFFGELEKRN